MPYADQNASLEETFPTQWKDYCRCRRISYTCLLIGVPLFVIVEIPLLGIIDWRRIFPAFGITFLFSFSYATKPITSFRCPRCRAYFTPWMAFPPARRCSNCGLHARRDGPAMKT